MVITRANWCPLKRGSHRGRPACSTTRHRARRGCSAAASSRARRSGPQRQRRRAPSVRQCGPKEAFGAVKGMAADIDRAGVEKAYERWAPIYDLVFGKVFDKGRQSTIAVADKIGGGVCDVGGGRGLALSGYL